MSSEIRERIVNGLLFQILWFACVVGAGLGLAWLGPLCLVAFAIWHLPRASAPRVELSLAAVAVAAGLLFETIQLQLGMVRYAAAGGVSVIPPLWILALWAGFAWTLNSSMAWLRGRSWLAALLGGVAGPLSFWSGAEVWSAVQFLRPELVVLGLYGAAWALILPLLFAASRRLERDLRHPVPPPQAPGRVVSTVSE